MKTPKPAGEDKKKVRPPLPSRLASSSSSKKRKHEEASGHEEVQKGQDKKRKAGSREEKAMTLVVEHEEGFDVERSVGKPSLPLRSLEKIASNVGASIWQVGATKALFEEGNTIPFIARYRKERTGGLDEVKLRLIQVGLEQAVRVEKRRETMVNALKKLGVFKGELAERLRQAKDLNELEDLYLPFKPTRTTRARAARDRGLEGLAKALLGGDQQGRGPWAVVKDFLRCHDSAGGLTAEEAIQGAKDIMAEMASEVFEGRVEARRAAWRGRLVSKAAKKGKQRKNGTGASTASATDPATYEGYTNYARRVEDVRGHVCLALNRGEALGFLTMKLEWEEGSSVRKCIDAVCRGYASLPPAFQDVVHEAVQDGVHRLIKPSIDREIRAEMTDKAVKEAIKVFSLNLEKLLLSPPLVGVGVLGCDPGFTHGVKLAAVSDTGLVLDTAVIFPFDHRVQEAEATVVSLLKRHGIRVVAVGNGVGCSQTEALIARILKVHFGAGGDGTSPIGWTVVNERGASVYSASELAAKELPDLDVTLRGAVSIARRLKDPLSELVKVDPKSLGVGLYQHDVKERLLAEELDHCVRMCVSRVGVDLNSASPSLLRYVSGLNKATADQIVATRMKQGPFRDRESLRQVRGIGPKVFEQASGFCRLQNSPNALDGTAVHPESYLLTAKLIRLLMRGDYKTITDGVVDAGELEAARGVLAALVAGKAHINKDEAASCLNVEPVVIREIATTLCDRGRDVRGDFASDTLWTGQNSLKDLKQGMELAGAVTNVVPYGVFVDLKAGKDGLLHISQIPNLAKVKEATIEDIINSGLFLGELVRVRVIKVDHASGKVGLALVDKKGG